MKPFRDSSPTSLIASGSSLAFLALLVAGAVRAYVDNRQYDIVIALYCISSYLFVQYGLLRLLKMTNPPFMRIVIVLLSFISLYLGSFLGWYSSPVYDKLIHFLIGAVVVYAGVLFSFKCRPEERSGLTDRQRVFLVLFAVCLSVTLSAFWEMIEFTSDRLFHSNFQRWANESPEAIIDTMLDQILGLAGAILAGLWLHQQMQKDFQRFRQRIIDPFFHHEGR